MRFGLRGSGLASWSPAYTVVCSRDQNVLVTGNCKSTLRADSDVIVDDDPLHTKPT
jgi:hypothetical protein